jgi:hypothetical protein
VLEILRGEHGCGVSAKADTVFSRGDPADCLFVVVDGSIASVLTTVANDIAVSRSPSRTATAPALMPA